MSNNKLISVVKNISYTFSSSLINLLISSLVILVVPKIVGVEEYGYWQLYLFYASYVGFFHLGWNDGVYLRYGGELYDKLNKKLFFSQFWMLFLSQLVISLIIGSFTLLTVINADEKVIFMLVALNLVIVNTNSHLLYILQTTNRLKEFAITTILDRLVYLFFIVFLIVFQIKNYQIMIIADLVGKLVSFIYTSYICKDIVFNKFSQFKWNFREMLENIKSGINLMIANIAATLIIGIVKYAIQRVWSVAIFGKISLTLSVSSLVTTFISAVSLAIFPILKRAGESALGEIYIRLRNILIILVLGTLVLYYPLNVVLSNWLPAYADSLEYMALIFPMVLFESKVTLLTNTYFKILRKERIIFKINLMTVGISLLFTAISAVWLQNLFLTMICIPFLLGIRSVIAEFYLSKFISFKYVKDTLLEVVLCLIFIISNWYIKSISGIFIYIIAYAVYLLLKKKDLKQLLTYAATIFKN